MTNDLTELWKLIENSSHVVFQSLGHHHDDPDFCVSVKAYFKLPSGEDALVERVIDIGTEARWFFGSTAHFLDMNAYRLNSEIFNARVRG